MRQPRFNDQFPRLHSVIAALWLGTATWSTVAQVPATPRVHWELLRLGGMDVGFGQVQEQWVVQQAERRLRTTAETHLQVKRFGQSVSQSLRLTSSESAAGELLEYASDVGSGRTSVKTIGRVRGNKLELTIESAGQRSQRVIEWQATYGSPFAVEHSLRERPPREGETRRFRMIVPIYNQLADVTLEVKGRANVDVLGEQRLLREVLHRTELDKAQSMVSRLWIDDAGDIVKTMVEGIGQETFRVPKERALQALGGQFDIGKYSSVPLAYAGNVLSAKSITYRARASGENARGLFLSDSRQVVHAVAAGEVLVEIGATKRPKLAERFSAEDLSAGALVQSNDPGVVELAEQAAGSEQGHEQVAKKLTRFVHANMRIRETSEAMASAAEVAKTLEGDCTEHAVLLAALCRARGIPARVALGLVYSSELRGFGYHMWTEAWVNDAWLSLDATRRDGTVGAGHLKMAVSNLNGVSPYEAFLPIMHAMGRLELEVVPTRPEP